MKFIPETGNYAPPVKSGLDLSQPAGIGALLTNPTRTTNRIAFTFLCVTLLALCASPAGAVAVAGDQCSGALPVGTATGCGVIITVTTVDGNGAATSFTVTVPNGGNGNPYDGVEDTLVGVQNNSGGTLNSMPLSSSANPGIFGFDGDGPCFYNEADCFGSTGYEGPNNTFAVTDVNHGTVNFTGIAAGGSTWFALEGTPNSLTLVSESQNLHFPPGTSTQPASFGIGFNSNSFALTSTNVLNPNGIDVTVTAHYVDTEFSNGGITGPGIVDGICENPPPSPVPPDDLDCLLAKNFTFATLSNGDQVVPHAPPIHNGQAVWYSTATTAVAGVDYVSGKWYDQYVWTTNPSLANPSPNSEWVAGWNNQNERLYDHPESDITDDFFLADITDFFNPGSSDPAGGGHQLNLNHWVWGAVPNGFTDTEETLLPIPGNSPFPYLKILPMLVTIELEKLNTEIPDPNALTNPNTLSVSTQDLSGNTIPVQFPKGFPTTFTCSKFFGKCSGFYYIFLSPAPYAKGVTYNMQITSDLFAPVNQQFVVK